MFEYPILYSSFCALCYSFVVCVQFVTVCNTAFVFTFYGTVWASFIICKCSFNKFSFIRCVTKILRLLCRRFQASNKSFSALSNKGNITNFRKVV